MSQVDLIIDKVKSGLISISVKFVGKSWLSLNIFSNAKTKNKVEEERKKILSVKFQKNPNNDISADEKLKSLGSKHHHHGSKTSIQTTSSKSSLTTEIPSQDNKAQPSTQTTRQLPTPTPSVESTRVETVADVHCPIRNSNEKEERLNSSDEENMAERRSQRAGRYDNIKQDGIPNIKRRSRSEGRSKGKKKQDDENYKDGKGRSGSYSKESSNKLQSRHSMYNEPLSDDAGFPDIKTSSSESEETLQKKWIKNPNMVKQARKNEKRKSMENGYHGRPNYLDLQGNKENIERGSQKDKYKRLEERRKKRVDMAITSDEELNSPEWRISRLRQRALQGARLSSKLPDRLDAYDAHKIHMDRLAVDLQQNKENESSSTSEQITLRPIGPGQASFSQQSVQSHVNKHPADVSYNQSHYGNQPVNIQPGKQTTHVQGPYRKIPKQETNFNNLNNAQVPDVTFVQGQPQQGPNGEYLWNFQNAAQQGRNFSYEDKNNLTAQKNPVYSNYQANVINQANRPVMKGKTKRKSHSDDSLDELIESNIQYLESEMESGKLRKISASQPGMFPTQQSDIYKKTEKRRSSSLEGIKSPPSNSFQNKIKLRLQVPSSKEQQYDNRSIQSSHYDRLSYSNSESTTPSSVYTLPPNDEYIYQNAVPKFERQFNSASHSPYLPRRTTAELSNMEDMSKSDSQLNFGEFGANYSNRLSIPSANFHGNASHNAPDLMTMSASAVEGNGMFSDVDYDIEVTDRIKRWEKYMKKKSSSSTSNESKSPVPLTTIMESEGGVPDSWTAKQPQSGLTVSSISFTVTKSVAQQPPPQKQEVYLEPKVQSAETNEHRIFRVVKQPKIEQKSDAVNFLSENIQKHAETVQKHAKVIRRSSSRDSDGGSQSHSQSEVVEENTTKMWPPMTKKEKVEHLKHARLSRFEEELTELQDIKSESVKDLRRRFDSDASGNESTEASTPMISTPLRQRRQINIANVPKPTVTQQPIKTEHISSVTIQPSFKAPSKVSSAEKPKQTDTSDVWSPKLESGQGPVSIERVKARTLQTIPFHEDPIWKEIEQMTTFEDVMSAQNFDNNESSRNFQAFQFPPGTQSSVTQPKPESSCQSYSPTIITTSRPIQTSSTTTQPKPKFFHTPTIQPLKLAIAAKSSIEALDEVLDDIRSSLQKKTPAPIRNQAVDSSASSSSVQSPVGNKNMVRNIPIQKVNNRQTRTGHHVSQKYFDQQKNLLSSKPREPQQDIRWVYPPKETIPGQQKPNTTYSYQKYNQTPPSNQDSRFDQSINWRSNQTYQSSQPNIQMNQTHQPNIQMNQIHQPNIQMNQTHQPNIQMNQAHQPNIQMNQARQPNIQMNQAHQPNIQMNQMHQQSFQPNQTHQNYSANQNNPQVVINPDFTQFPYVINGNYQLDPSDLKTRLMNTGLAFDTQSEMDETMSQRSYNSNCSAEHERQFNQSIEDLQNLARDVEEKLSQIKCKIVDADENRLDSILSALRKFAPSEPVKTPPNIHTKEEQDRQRGKLNEALAELDRIYYNLHLDDPKLNEPKAQVDLMTQSQTLPSQGHHSDVPLRRNKSDSGFGHYSEATVAQVEQQTQEFDDITKSFQTLLDEVSKDETTVSSKPSQHAAEIENTIESFLDEFRTSDGNLKNEKSTSEKFESKLKNAKNAARQNTCRDVQKSEVFTVSSGNFSALVGVKNKNKKNEANLQKQSSKQPQTKTISKFRAPIKVTPKATEQKVVSSTAKINLVSPTRELKVIKTSGSESEDVSENIMMHKAKRNVNLQHRKSMPACMRQRTVETQTAEPSSPPVAVIRRNFQTNSRQSRENSVSSESSAESRKARRKTISKGIALLMEFFSSSEDERNGKHGLEHSTSAPDLRYVGCEKMTKSPSENEKLKNRSKHPKAKHMQKSKKRSSYIKFDDIDDKIDDLYVTSTTSDENVQVTKGTKPPRHPKRKQSANTPDHDESEAKNSQKQSLEGHTSKSDIKQEVVLRKKKQNQEEQERPHSFHELLSTFEQNPDKLKKSLRKCSSAEAMLQEQTTPNDIFHSDPDLRKDSQFNSGTQTEVNVNCFSKVKDTAV